MNKKSTLRSVANDYLTHPKTSKGITLVALVVTIIVLLILAGVSIATLVRDNGIINRTATAKQTTEEKAELEKVKLAVQAARIHGNSYSDLTVKDVKDALEYDHITVTGSTFPLTATSGLYQFTIDAKGNVSKPFSAIFDSTGTDNNKLHIGDFVNYTAGTWDDTSLGRITATGAYTSPTTARPSEGYTFGGFSSNASRDGNALPFDNSYNYVKDSDDNPITGWRVFDVDTDKNRITLISAGCPEDYYHPYESGMGYKSQYILSGDETGVSNDIKKSCTPRDWSMYENSSQGAIEGTATALTLSQLNAWYTKYIVADPNAIITNPPIFQIIYNSNYNNKDYTKYQTLIDTYSYYWLAATYSEYANGLYFFYPYGKMATYNNIYYAFGVRVLVSISGVQLEKSNTTKTLKDPRNAGTTYTYGYWTIQ